MLELLSAADVAAYSFVNQHWTSTWLDPLALFVSSETLWLVLGTSLTAWALVQRNGRLVKLLAVLVAVVALTDLSSYQILKPSFHRVRPCHSGHTRRVNGICGSEYGMPSNHAANGMAITTVLAVFAGRTWFLAALLSTLLVGFSRVYLGVHYPGDVLVGYVFGALTGGLVSICLIFIKRKTHELGNHTHRTQKTLG